MNTHAVPPPAQNLGDATDSKNSSSRIRLAELGKMFRGELWSIPQFRVTSSEFRNDVWYKKKLECYHIMIQTMTCSAVLKQFMSVTDGRTDGHC